MDIQKLKRFIPEDYSKHASRDLTLFTTSIFGESYVRTFREEFRIPFRSVFWVQRKDNFVTFYRSEKDHLALRDRLGQMLQEDGFAENLIKKLSYFTDWFNDFHALEYSPGKFNKRKKEYIDNYRKFFAYHQAVYWSGDFLVENHPEKKETISSLQKVYSYNENVIPEVDRYVNSIGIGKLRYDQDSGKFIEQGIFFLQDQKNIYLYGADLEEIESYIVSLRSPHTARKQLKGISASRGKIRGRIQLITDPNKLDQAKPGFILVTGMTRPQFNDTLRGCKGIITDEGNILSHASILTREFGIPSIVGTRNATEVLRDGDIVELDATNGSVKIIKRKNN